MQDEQIMGLIALLGGVIALITPLIKLNSNLVKLNTNFEHMMKQDEKRDKDIKNNSIEIHELAQKVTNAEKVIDVHHLTLSQHEKRIEKLEEEKQ